MIAIAIASRQQTLFSDRASLQEWEVTMKTSNTRARKLSLTVGKIMMALVFVSMIGGTFITPAFGRDNGRQGYNDRYRYEHGRRVYNQPVIIRGPAMPLHRSSMPRPRISHRASAFSSPSVSDRGSLCVDWAALEDLGVPQSVAHGATQYDRGAFVPRPLIKVGLKPFIAYGQVI